MIGFNLTEILRFFKFWRLGLKLLIYVHFGVILGHILPVIISPKKHLLERPRCDLWKGSRNRK